jgi:hypothetical protein
LEHPWFYPPSLLGVGHAGTLHNEEEVEVLLWVPDPKERAAWKSERWVARERVEERRKIGFRVSKEVS